MADSRFTVAEWGRSEDPAGSWYVHEHRRDGIGTTIYGPMWEEMVEPLIDELREIVLRQYGYAADQIRARFLQPQQNRHDSEDQQCGRQVVADAL